jgi:hypothetical protein
VGVGCAAPERIMTTAKFLKQMGKKEGFKKEVQGFAARWVHGTGALCTVLVLFLLDVVTPLAFEAPEVGGAQLYVFVSDCGGCLHSRRGRWRGSKWRRRVVRQVGSTVQVCCPLFICWCQ